MLQKTNYPEKNTQKTTQLGWRQNAFLGKEKPIYNI